MTIAATSELVAIAWLKTLDGISTNVATTVPQDLATWSDTGFIQVAVTGDNSNRYYALRQAVVTAHCWAVNPNKQNPPWGKANALAERIVAGLYNEDACNTSNFTIGPSGMAEARVLSAHLMNGPRRSTSDKANYAHYICDFTLSWTEVTP